MRLGYLVCMRYAFCFGSLGMYYMRQSVMPR